LSETGTLFGSDEISICDALYKNADKDTVYYGMLANQLNMQFC